jgi:hypothetical protein
MASDGGNRPAKGEGTELAKATKKPAAEKKLVEKINSPVEASLLAGFAKSGKSTELSIYNEITITQNMTAETANALVQSSHNRYVAPAQERTARSVEQTKRYAERTKQLKIGGFFGFLFVVGICIRPEAALSIAGVAGATGISLVSYDFFNRKKRKLPSRTRKSLP